MKSMKYGEYKYNVGVGYYIVTPKKNAEKQYEKLKFIANRNIF